MSGDKQVGKQPSRLLSKLKSNGLRIALATILMSVVTVSLGFAEENPKKAFSTIYHIYEGEAYLGATSSEEQIKKVIDEKQQLADEQYQDLFVDVDSNIVIVPEQVFTVAVNDEEVLEKLQEALVVKASAFSLQVDGKVVGHLKDKASYDEALRLFMLQYISAQELDAYTANTQPVSLTSHDQTRITDISLSGTVTGGESRVNPADILTPQQAAELLTTGGLEKQTYTVKQGDVLGSIAKAHNLKLKELLALNPGLTEKATLKINQPLNVTVSKPLLTVKVVMEKYRVEKVSFKRETKKDATMLKGESNITQQGKDGEKQVLYTITTENGVRKSKSVTTETVTRAAINEVKTVGTKVISSRGTGAFAWPTNGGYISSHMGERYDGNHRGIDIARPSNYTIKAADNGAVTAVGWEGTYGNRIVIDHKNGYKTVYAHLSEFSVAVGQVVEQGQQIGVMGSTGNSTGIHLHFEVQKNGTLVNPLSVLQ